MRKEENIEIGPLERDWGTAIQSVGAETCPTASELIDFVELGSRSKYFGPIVKHLGQCKVCRKSILDMKAADAARQAAHEIKRTPSWMTALLGPRRLALAGAFVACVAVGLAYIAHPLVFRATPVAVNHNPPSVSKGPGLKPQPGVGHVASTGSNRSLSALHHRFLLVGSRHVYSMESANAKLAERRQIEESFADQVASTWDSFRRLPRQAKSLRVLKDGLDRAESERDEKLGKLFSKENSSLAESSYLKLEGSAPYQVVDVEYREKSGAIEPERFVVESPWPGYRPTAVPYGWKYNHPYRPAELNAAHTRWRTQYVEEGKPAFTGLVGHGRAVTIRDVHSDEGGYSVSAPAPVGSPHVPLRSDQDRYKPRLNYGEPSAHHPSRPTVHPVDAKPITPTHPSGALSTARGGDAGAATSSGHPAGGASIDPSDIRQNTVPEPPSRRQEPPAIDPSKMSGPAHQPYVGEARELGTRSHSPAQYRHSETSPGRGQNSPSDAGKFGHNPESSGSRSGYGGHGNSRPEGPRSNRPFNSGRGSGARLPQGESRPTGSRTPARRPGAGQHPNSRGPKGPSGGHGSGHR